MSTPTTPAPRPANPESLEPTKKPKAAKPRQQAVQPIKRLYREEASFYSDLFKLGVAKMLRWTGWTKVSQNAPRDEKGNINTPDWVEVEHCHFFHTIDSNGKMQDYCQPVGQHVHKIEVVRDPRNPEDILEVKCVSGPLRWEITDKYGKRQKMLMPVPHDDHTHEMMYVKSNKINRPSMNSEAVKVIGRVQAQQDSRDVYDEDGKPLGKLSLR